MSNDTDTKTFVRTVVEFPLVGFLVAPCVLTKEQWLEYARMDEDASSNDDKAGALYRVIGASNQNNICFKWRLRTDSVFTYPWCCLRNRDGVPPSVTCCQAFFYPFAIPFTRKFWSALSKCGVAIFVLNFYWFLGMLGLDLGTFWAFYFFPILIIFFAYGDRLFVSRLVHDIPNLIMTATYLSIVKFSAVSFLSAVQNGVLVGYYMSRLVYRIVKDCYVVKEERSDRMEDAYGEMTSGRALWFSLCHPFWLMSMCPWFAFFLFCVPRRFFGDWSIYAPEDGATVDVAPAPDNTGSYLSPDAATAMAQRAPTAMAFAVVTEPLQPGAASHPDAHAHYARVMGDVGPPAAVAERIPMQVDYIPNQV